MKVFLVIAICLQLGRIGAAHKVSIEADVCDDGRCNCEAPREPTPENMEYNEDLECYCACGSGVDGDCLVDGDCVHGLHCGAGETVSGKGQCKDACKKPGFDCGIFDKCVVNANGDPECKCNIRACSDILIGSGVCSVDPQEKDATHTFNNDCLFVNEQCKRRKEGRNQLERHPILKCSVEIEPNLLNAGVLSGWRMSGI